MLDHLSPLELRGAQLTGSAACSSFPSSDSLVGWPMYAQRGPWMHSPFRKNACAFRTSCASSPCFYPCWGPAQLSSHLWDSSPDSGYFL